MKKILYIETALTGHHKIYLTTLAQEMQKLYDVHCILPQTFETSVPCTTISADFLSGNLFRQFFGYLRWMRKIREIVEDEKPDVVHFIYGDVFYRFFGMGLSCLERRAKVCITLHQIRRSRLRDLSVNRICRHADAVVVHTESLKKTFRKLELNVIDYPDFLSQPYETKEAKAVLGLNADVPVLLALGGTRRDKGLDILLQALRLVAEPFQLLIAGEEIDVTREEIETLASQYREKLTLRLHRFSNAELQLYLAAADIIVLPYRKSFDGASGPLSEGVSNRKVIVGPSHGSLGALIRDHHLGYTFETENCRSLSEAISKSLQHKFICDERYQNYRNAVSVTQFCRSYADLYKKMTEGN